jgi:hypothetical protein
MKKLVLAVVLNTTLGNICHALFIGSSMFFNSLRVHMFAEFMAGFSIAITLLLIGFFLVRERVRHRAATYGIIFAITMTAVYAPLLVLVAMAFKKIDADNLLNYAGIALMYLAFDALYWVIFTQVNYFLLRVKRV